MQYRFHGASKIEDMVAGAGARYGRPCWLMGCMGRGIGGEWVWFLLVGYRGRRGMAEWAA